jgi:hypothetical protein
LATGVGNRRWQPALATGVGNQRGLRCLIGAGTCICCATAALRCASQCRPRQPSPPASASASSLMQGLPQRTATGTSVCVWYARARARASGDSTQSGRTVVCWARSIVGRAQPRASYGRAGAARQS